MLARDPVSGWNRAGERSGVAPGPVLVDAVDKEPPLVARLGGWILVSGSCKYLPTQVLSASGPTRNSPASPPLGLWSMIHLPSRFSPGYPGPTALISVFYLCTCFSFNPHFPLFRIGSVSAFQVRPHFGIRCSRALVIRIRKKRTQSRLVSARDLSYFI